MRLRLRGLRSSSVRDAEWGRLLRFESLEGRRLLAADFGDAPSPYPTLLIDDGPYHEAIGPMLGTTRDSEGDGSQESQLADGDDSLDESDEDGISFSDLRVGERAASILAQVSNAQFGARLDEWIDFDRDGTWSGPWEHVVSDYAVLNGDNDVFFDIPSTASSGPTYARFRISSVGDLSTTGSAPDGEVEDYLINIAPPSASGGRFGLPNVMLTGLDRLTSVLAVDVDNDGDLDLVATDRSESSTSVYQDELAWYENKGTQGYEKHDIVSAVEQIKLVSAADIDQDGDVDLFTTAYRDEYLVAWHENAGRRVFQTHVIAVGENIYGRNVEVVDFDLDGDFDLVAALSNSFVWYESNGEQAFTAAPLSPDYHGGSTVDVVDIDRDGDLDVVGATWGDREILLFRQTEAGFEEVLLATTEGYGNHAVVANLYGEDDPDILVASYSDGSVAWLENYSEHSTFVERPITSSAHRTTSLQVVDLNGDGQGDALYNADSRGIVSWWKNRGDRSFTSSGGAKVEDPTNVVPVDMDGDGDLDILVGSQSEGTISWYENTHYLVDLSSAYPREHHEDDLEALSTVGFRRYGDLSQPLSISFEIGGTAELNVDYAIEGAAVDSSIGTIEFPANEEFIGFSVLPLADSLYELDETIDITVIDGHDYVRNRDTPRTIKIIDDEDGDFGDAPFPYPTTREEDGPKHGPAGPFFGTSKDAEPDGQSSDGATGDDVSTSDDEDGVTWALMRVGQKAATLTVEANDVTGTAYVDAWIDFNGDGNWTTSDEHILASAPLVAGKTTLEFEIPATAMPGTTYDLEVWMRRLQSSSSHPQAKHV